uniref:Uncharacterized protein n=1 Tax=Rhizophora mucronata TaxID=61149 RepID=A0A2P2PWY5_RHIMU
MKLDMLPITIYHY